MAELMTCRTRKAVAKNPFDRRGFTLIELIVVLLLAALAAGMVFINVGQARQDQEGRFFARELHRLLRTARTQAISSGTVRMVVISADERRCWVDPRKALTIPDRVRIQGRHLAQPQEGQHGVYFYPDGSSSGGLLTVSENEQFLLRMRVDPLTGLIVLTDADD